MILDLSIFGPVGRHFRLDLAFFAPIAYDFILDLSIFVSRSASFSPRPCEFQVSIISFSPGRDFVPVARSFAILAQVACYFR